LLATLHLQTLQTHPIRKWLENGIHQQLGINNPNPEGGGVNGEYVQEAAIDEERLKKREA